MGTNASKPVRTLRGHTRDVYACAISPDGRQALSGSGDETLIVWDLHSGEALRTLREHTKECPVSRHSVPSIAHY